MSAITKSFRSFFDLMDAYGFNMVMVYEREGVDLENEKHAVSVVSKSGKVYKFHTNPAEEKDEILQAKWDKLMLEWEKDNSEDS